MTSEFFKTLWGKTLGLLAIAFMILEIYNQAIAAMTNTYQMRLARANSAIRQQDEQVLTAPVHHMSEAEAWRQVCEVEKLDVPACQHKPPAE